MERTGRPKKDTEKEIRKASKSYQKQHSQEKKHEKVRVEHKERKQKWRQLIN